MQGFQHILVPVDFSEASKRALRRAIHLARGSGGHLTLVHVGLVPGYAGYDLGGYGAPYPETLVTLHEQIATEQKHALEKLAREEVPDDVPWQSILREGWAPDEICAEATAGKVDLICMGTHGRTGLGRVLMGSVAERVVAKAHCPVLLER